MIDDPPENFDRIPAPEPEPTIMGCLAVLDAAGRDRCTVVQRANSERPLAFYVVLAGKQAIREVAAPLRNLFAERFPNPKGTEGLELFMTFLDKMDKAGDFMRDNKLHWVYSQYGPILFVGMRGNDICLAAEPILNAANCTTNIV